MILPLLIAVVGLAMLSSNSSSTPTAPSGPTGPTPPAPPKGNPFAPLTPEEEQQFAARALVAQISAQPTSIGREGVFAVARFMDEHGYGEQGKQLRALLSAMGGPPSFVSPGLMAAASLPDVGEALLGIIDELYDEGPTVPFGAALQRILAAAVNESSAQIAAINDSRQAQARV